MSKHIKWTPERVEYLKLWQERGTALNKLDVVKDGKASINAIKNAAHRYLGFGSQQDKVTGDIKLTSRVSSKRPNQKRCRRSVKSSESIETTQKTKNEVVAQRNAYNWEAQMFMQMLIKSQKDRRLTNIIASLRVLNHDKLAADIEYCIK